MKRTGQWLFLVVGLAIGGISGPRILGSLVHGGSVPDSIVQRDPATFRDIVKATLPAVVSIDSKVTVKRADARPGRRFRAQDDTVPEEMRKFLEEMERRQAEMPPDGVIGSGSGFIIDPKGVILTCNHVVDRADQVVVTLGDGRKFTSKEIKTDERTDLAIIRIDTKGSPLPALELGDSTAMEIGDRVLAVGAPFGLSGSVTHGIVSAKGRDLKLNRYDDFIQTDAAINPGNSGGPLINMEGKVIAINSAIKSRNGGFQGVGMAISSNIAKKIVAQLLKDGIVKRGYLGILMAHDVTPEVAERLGFNGQGVVVAQVYENTPAAKAGLKPDDVIVSIGGRPVRDNRELQRVVGDAVIGNPMDVVVERDGKKVSLKLTLEEEPKNYGRNVTQPLRVPRNVETVAMEGVGLEMVDLTSERAEALGLKEGGGALIVRVEANSLAADAGLSRGSVIMKVNKKAVDSAAAAKEAIEKSGDAGALLHVHVPQSGTEIVLLKTK